MRADFKNSVHMTPRGTLAVVAALARRQHRLRPVKIFSPFAAAIYTSRTGRGTLGVRHTCGAARGTCVSARLRTSWHAGGQRNDRRTMLTGERTYAAATVSFRVRSQRAAQKSDTSIAQLRPTPISGGSDNYRHDNNATD